MTHPSPMYNLQIQEIPPALLYTVIQNKNVVHWDQYRCVLAYKLYNYNTSTKCILVKGNVQHKYDLCLKCTFNIAIMAAGFYFEKFLTIS